ncbi:MAG TPA: murein L,D-transpeptidase catalytic domain family protein [Chitinophagaceae bacterium]|jgi:hypothetical protein|nr:murein L,D-transpeptidase catalytic domain family protein [Chitinophagaceae bacterium]
MQKNILPLFLYLFSFLVLTSFNNAAESPATTVENKVIEVAETVAETTSSLSASLYTKLDLESKSLAPEVLEDAIKGYEKLVAKGLVRNDQYLTIVDMSQSSRSKRLYIIDVKNQRLAQNTYVSHGKNSGLDRAERFSNVPESEQSSLGFYVTKNTYSGKHGLSLKLSGVERGFNDNAEARAIVVHGAEYVNEARANSAYMGRSQGCPAVPQAQAKKIISLIKDGSALFIYHPNQKYLTNSKLLNS